MATDQEPEEGKKALTLKRRTTSLASDYVRKLREELTQVGERVDFITSQIDNIEAATPELDRKLHYARIGRPLTSLSIESLLQLKLINRKLLQFWVDLNKKQLEKLDFLAESLLWLEDQMKYVHKTGFSNPDAEETFRVALAGNPLSEITKKREIQHVHFLSEPISCKYWVRSSSNSRHWTLIHKSTEKAE